MIQLTSAAEHSTRRAMPRLGRLDAPGVLQHIMIRGNERRNIFKDDTDREDFLARLAKLLPETQTACYACDALLTKWKNPDGVQPRPSESSGEESDTAGAAQRSWDGIPQACYGRFQQRGIILVLANVSRRVGLAPFRISKAVSQTEK